MDVHARNRYFALLFRSDIKIYVVPARGVEGTNASSRPSMSALEAEYHRLLHDVFRGARQEKLLCLLLPMSCIPTSNCGVARCDIFRLRANSAFPRLPGHSLHFTNRTLGHFHSSRLTLHLRSSHRHNVYTYTGGSYLGVVK